MLKTLLGIFLLIAGFVLAFLYLTNINNGASALLLIPSFLIVVVAVFILVRTGKSDTTVIMNPRDTTSESSQSHTQNIGLLQKNNELTQTWLKSVEKRDKMRLLQIAASEEDSDQ